MDDAPNCDGVCQEPGSLSHASIVVDGFELSSIQKSIPIGHVDQSLLHLWTSIFELGEETAGSKIMIILIDLSQGVANLEMFLVAIGPVFGTAGHRNATVRALKIDSSWWGATMRLMVMVGAARMLSDIGRPSSDLGDWGVGEGVEKVIGSKDSFRFA